MSRIRTSKFRNLDVKPHHIDEGYLDLNLQPPSDTASSNLGLGKSIGCSRTYIAFPAGPSAHDVGVVSTKDKGKRTAHAELKGHSGTITDLDFSSLDEGLCATSANDGTALLWRLEEAVGVVKLNETKPMARLHALSTSSSSSTGHGHGQGHGHIIARWSPVATGIVMTMSASDGVIKIWDVDKNSESAASESALTVSPPAANNLHAYTAQWDYSGNQVIMSCNDGTLRLIDPRTGTEVNRANNAHKNAQKPICVEWGGNSTVCYTTGYSISRNREIGVWDTRNLAEPLARVRVDENTGVLHPHYDSDTGLLYLSGSGDVNLKVYEAAASSPFLFGINTFNIGGEPARGSGAFLPKAALDILGCEVGRYLKLSSNRIETSRIEVPRRQKRNLQEDLFPPTAAQEEALSATEWLDGNTANPKLIPVKNLLDEVKQGSGPPKKVLGTPPEKLAPKPQVPEPAEGEGAAVNDNSATTTPSFEASPEELKEMQEREKALNQKFSKFLGYQAKFKYVRGEEARRDQSFYGLKPNVTIVDSEILACNDKLFAVPWEGSGGPVYVGDLSKPGKLTTSMDLPLLKGHRGAVNAIQFDPFKFTRLATAGDDALIRVWNIPEAGIHTQEEAETAAEQALTLRGHQNEVRYVGFNPVAEGIVTSTSLDNSVKIWDAEQGTVVLNLATQFQDLVANLDWSYDGSHFVTSGRDKMTAVVDPRSGKVEQNRQTHEGAKGHRAAYLGNNPYMITTGFSKMAGREVKIWDSRKLSNCKEPLFSTKLDPGSGLINPYVIEDNGVVLLTGKGEQTVRVLEIEGLHLTRADIGKFEGHRCADFVAKGDPHASFALLPRRTCDPNKGQVARALRLTSSSVDPVTFVIPRSEDVVGYFADHLYPDTRAPEPVLSKTEWLDKKKSSKPKTMSMNQGNLPLLSARDPNLANASIKKGQASTLRFKKKQEEEEKREQKQKEHLEEMKRKAELHEQYNPNLSMGKTHEHAVDEGVTEVAEDEWDE